MRRHLIVLVAVAPLAACSGLTTGTVTTTGGDAIACAASLAAAYAVNPVSIITSGLAGCAGLTADVLAQIEGKAKVAAAQARTAAAARR